MYMYVSAWEDNTLGVRQHDVHVCPLLSLCIAEIIFVVY